jgi:hypothetical protein
LFSEVRIIEKSKIEFAVFVKNHLSLCLSVSLSLSLYIYIL